MKTSLNIDSLLETTCQPCNPNSDHFLDRCALPREVCVVEEPYNVIYQYKVETEGINMWAS